MTAETITASPPRPDAAVMKGVIPYLGMDGKAAEAADFYSQAFGARDIGRVPDQENPGRFMHVQVEINGGCVMMTDCRDPSVTETPKPQGVHMQLIVTDGDTWWSRAVKAGCTVTVPFERQFWGDRWGMLRDPFGIDWAIGEPAE